jgi:hypothetical protein
MGKGITQCQPNGRTNTDTISKNCSIFTFHCVKLFRDNKKGLHFTSITLLLLNLLPLIDERCRWKRLSFINFSKDIRHLMNITFRKNTIGGNLQFVTTFHLYSHEDFIHQDS